MSRNYDSSYGRFGHKAVVQVNTSVMAALGGIADIKSAWNRDFKGPLSAQSGRPINLDNDTGLTPVNAPQRHDPVSLRAYETKIV